MKVNELAKELRITSSQLLKTLKSLGVKIKGPISTLDDKIVASVRWKLSSTLKSSIKPKRKQPTKKKGPSKEVKRPTLGAKVTKAKKEKPSPKPGRPKRTKKETLKIKKGQVEEVVPKPVVLEERPEIKPQVAEVKEEVEEKKLVELEVDFPINVKELSVKLSEKPSVLIKRLMEKKIFVNLNQSLDDEVAKNLAKDFGFMLKPAPTEEDRLLAGHFVESEGNLEPRYPVVTFMGHVDHGKTSILDYIRKSKLADREHGGITQHIGAYEVNLKKGKITFLDTPGHEAFTAMRARGANVTDIVVLVVAVDDGVMPQTIEAIDHAKAAGVPIVVAINKIDKARENLNMVKGQLSKYGLTSEDIGGKTITIPVSAKTGEGIDELLELILLEAEMLELKADFRKSASAVVVEADLSKGRGVEATVLVKQGILHKGDIVIVEEHFGKVKAMFDSLGKAITEAGPSTAVNLLGLSGLPLAGEILYAVSDEKLAKQIALRRKEAKERQKYRVHAHISLEDLHQRVKEGKIKELNIILKADVSGSVEALNDSLKSLGTDEVKIRVIHSGVGAVNSSDVILAAASDAVIIGFHVQPDAQAKEIASREDVQIRTYQVIYEAIREVRAALEGLLEPRIKRNFIGKVLVRKIFNLTKAGKVAGCFVQKGKVNRNNQVILFRNGENLFEGKLGNLKRFKDDVKEVGEGTECGISLSGFTDIQVGDILEVFEEEKIARKL